MPSARNDVIEAIRKLEADRQRHVKAIHDIDAILNRVSRAVAPVAEDGALPTPSGAAATPQTTHRGKFRQTGEQSILQFVRSVGSPTTSEINEHWRGEGRRGVANVVLLKLLKQGLITRRHDPGARGSRYAVVVRRIADSGPPPTADLRGAESVPTHGLGRSPLP